MENPKILGRRLKNYYSGAIENIRDMAHIVNPCGYFENIYYKKQFNKYGCEKCPFDNIINKMNCAWEDTLEFRKSNLISKISYIIK